MSETKDPNIQNYYVGTFLCRNTNKNIDVFLHEAVWVLHNKKLIPNDKLVAHLDGNTYNNSVENLYLVDENKEYGDLHTNKIFHENSYNKEFVEEHFKDVYLAIQKS